MAIIDSLLGKLDRARNNSGFVKYFWNTGWLFASRVISSLISFVVTAYVVRELGPTDYGQLSYAVSFVAIFSFISTLGLDTVLYRDIVKNPNNTGVYFGSAILLRLIAGFVASTICVISALFLTDNRDISLFLILIIAPTLIFSSFSVIGYEFQYRVQSKYLSISSLIVLITLNILKLIVIFSDKGVIYLSAVLLLEPILTAIVFIIYRKVLYGPFSGWKFDKTIAINMLKDSWPTMLAGGFIIIYSRVDQIFIKHLIDLSSVGLYDAAVRVSEVWFFIPGIIVSSFFPAIINAKSVSESQYLLRLKRLGILLLSTAIVISAFISIFAVQIISLIYGESFVEQSSLVLRIYVWGGIGVSLGALTTNYLITENLRKATVLTALLAMTINVVLNIILIPKMGIVGSAWATAISYLAIPLSILLFKKPRQSILEMLRN